MERAMFLIILYIIKLSHQQNDDESTTGIIIEDETQICEARYQKCEMKIVNNGGAETATASALGLKGVKGDPGERGPKGESGENRWCGCEKFNITKDEFISGLPRTTTKTKDGKTCIVYQKNITGTAMLDEKQCTYEGKLREFWYSECRYKLQEFYEMSTKDLRYIAENFDSITQKFRYHCKRSLNLRNNTNYYFRLLSWNNVIIGPKPSDTSPFTYDIPEEFDGCKGETGADKDEWKNSIIEVASNLNLKLPIIDLQIRDIQLGKKQSFFVEPVDLCFE